MSRNKYLLAILLILTLSLFAIYANAEWENVLLAQSTEVINNQSVLIELSQPKTIDFSVFSSIAYTAPYKSSYENDDIVLFAIIDTLDSDKNSGDISLSITSDDATGFFFTKDGNETNKLRYEMEVCLLEFSYQRKYTRPYYSYEKTTKSQKLQENTETTIGDNKKTKFEPNGINGYKLSIPVTDYTSWAGVGLLGDYPKHIRYYYVSVKILGGQNLEEGTYTSSFYVESEGLIPKTKYTIKGYVGEKPFVETTSCNFYIDPGADSYFTDLVVKKGETSPSKEVAILQLYKTRREDYSDTPSANNLKKKYTVYISPTSIYTDNGRYVFKKIGTENQSDDNFAYRIYYEIDTTNTTGLTKLNNTNNTYYFYPEYTNQLISTSSGTKTYQEFWKLEDKHIYIKVSEESKEDDENMHAIGTYTSKIYFTIVPNDSL